MKKLLSILLLSVMTVFSAETYYINSFRDMKFKDSIDKLGKYEIIDENKNIKYVKVVKINEDLELDGLKVDRISYNFLDEKLFQVEIVVFDKNTYDDIVKDFEIKYKTKFIHSRHGSFIKDDFLNRILTFYACCESGRLLGIFFISDGELTPKYLEMLNEYLKSTTANKGN